MKTLKEKLDTASTISKFAPYTDIMFPSTVGFNTARNVILERAKDYDLKELCDLNHTVEQVFKFFKIK